MLARAVEEKDGYTGEHANRIAQTSRELGQAFGLTETRLEQLTLAAKLHDVGKIGVPDAILNKPGNLNSEEWEAMKGHVEIGRDLLTRIQRLQPVAHIVEQHHEHWDGNGYPHGLSGEEILLEARILSVADAYDAMTTDRPYRHALSPEAVRTELQRNAGSQFDPQVVEAFLTLADGSSV